MRTTKSRERFNRRASRGKNAKIIQIVSNFILACEKISTNFCFLGSRRSRSSHNDSRTNHNNSRFNPMPTIGGDTGSSSQTDDSTLDYGNRNDSNATRGASMAKPGTQFSMREGSGPQPNPEPTPGTRRTSTSALWKRRLTRSRQARENSNSFLSEQQRKKSTSLNPHLRLEQTSPMMDGQRSTVEALPRHGLTAHDAAKLGVGPYQRQFANLAGLSRPQSPMVNPRDDPLGRFAVPLYDEDGYPYTQQRPTSPLPYQVRKKK